MKSTRLSLKDVLALGPIIGSDGEGGEGAPAGGAGGAGEGAPAGGAAGDGAGAGGGASEGGDPQKKIAALAEEKDRHFKARQDAERERDDLKKWKEEQERKDKTEVENAKADLDKVKNELAASQATIKALLVKNAFLQVTDVEWHNPERALSLVDLSDVEVKDGTVDNEAVKKAVKTLAADEPYLVKPKEDPKNPPKGPTGTPPGGGAAGGDPKADAARLAQKYPALRQHGVG